MANQNEEIDLKIILHRFLKKWYWFVISLIICSGLGALYYNATNPVYTVSSKIMLRLDDDNMLRMPQMDMLLMMGGFNTQRQVVNELEIIKSQTIMQQSIIDLGLQTEYRKRKGLRWIGQYPKGDLQIIYPDCFTDTLRHQIVFNVSVKSSGYKLEIKYGKKCKNVYNLTSLEQPINTFIGNISFKILKQTEKGDKYRITVSPLIYISDFYRDKTSIDVLNHSNVISISTDTDIPARAVNIINNIISLYNDDAVKDRAIVADNTRNFIDDRLKVVEEELNEMENKMEIYMKNNAITDLSNETMIVLKESSEYQKSRVEIETQQSLLNALRTFVTDIDNKNSFIPAKLGVDDSSLEQVVNEYNELLLTRLKIERSATDDNPMLTQLEKQLQVMHTNVIQSIETAENALNIKRNNLLQQEKIYADKIENVPTKEREFINIKRQQEMKEQIYLFLLQKKEEDALSLASMTTSTKIIDQPQIPSDPTAPKKILIALIVLFLGLVLPAGLILLCDLLNNKVEDKKQFEELVKAPVIGQLLHNRKHSLVVATRNENSLSAELFRSIRTNIKFMLPDDQQSKVVLVTSSVNGEGKSFVAINTALSMALLGKRVALVELDFRKPTLAADLGFQSKGTLTTYLSNPDYRFDDVIIPSGWENNLDVLPAGIVSMNPNELLSSERLDNLFTELRKHYDYIFIDSAPVTIVSDTFLLDRLTDITLYVSRANYTTTDIVEFLNQIYEQKRLKNIVCVLNGIKASDIGYTYGYI